MSAQQSVDKRADIPSLTGLRGLAAWLIVWAHFNSWYFQHDNPPHWLAGSWNVANLGMTLFFVLSGFVIHYNYGQTVGTFRARALWSFFVARFARLYPLYIFALAVEFAMRNADAFSSGTVAQVWPAYLTLTQNWIPPQFQAQPVWSLYLSGAWSISAEVFLYLIYLIVCRPLQMLRTPRITTIVIIAFAIFATTIFAGRAADLWLTTGNVEIDHWWWYVSPYCRVPEFLLGVMCAQLYGQCTRTVSIRETALGYGLAIAAAGWTVLLFALPRMALPGVSEVAEYWYWQHFQQSWGFAPAAAALIYFFARYRNRLALIVENRLLLAFGAASYSTYLLHPAIVWLFGHSQVESGAFAYFRIAITLIVIAFLSFGCYQYLEMPARKVIRRLLDRPWLSTRRLPDLYGVRLSAGALQSIALRFTLRPARAPQWQPSRVRASRP